MERHTHRSHLTALRSTLRLFTRLAKEATTPAVRWHYVRAACTIRQGLAEVCARPVNYACP